MRKNRNQRSLTDFQARAIEVLLRKPRHASSFASAMGYNSMGPSPWATPALQGTSKLGILRNLGFAYKDKSCIWHVTELGVNRLLNYYGEEMVRHL